MFKFKYTFYLLLLFSNKIFSMSRLGKIIKRVPKIAPKILRAGVFNPSKILNVRKYSHDSKKDKNIVTFLEEAKKKPRLIEEPIFCDTRVDYSFHEYTPAQIKEFESKELEKKEFVKFLDNMIAKLNEDYELGKKIVTNYLIEVNRNPIAKRAFLEYSPTDFLSEVLLKAMLIKDIDFIYFILNWSLNWSINNDQSTLYIAHKKHVILAIKFFDYEILQKIIKLYWKEQVYFADVKKEIYDLRAYMLESSKQRDDKRIYELISNYWDNVEIRPY